jgi:hypothetical protein
MNLYTHARKYIDVKDLRHLSKEKIKKRNIAEVQKQQEIILDELKKIEIETSPKFCNWRRELREGMTTGAMMSTQTIDAEGDVDLVPTTTNVVGSNFSTNLNWSASNGVATSADDPSRIIPGATSTVFRRADMKIPIPADKNISTVKITVSKGGGTLNWTDRDPAESFDADLYLTVNGGIYKSISNAGSGVHTFEVDPSGNEFSPGFVFVNFGQFAKIGETGQTTVQISFQRRTPINVIVGLDDPEAVSFIRTDPTMQGLSAAQREKKLLEMLEAGDEYLLKQLGIIGSSARPEATKDPVSWEQAGLRPDGTQGQNKVGDVVPDHFGNPMKLVPRPGYGYNQWVPVKKASGGKDYGNIAQIPPGMRAPHSNIKYDKQMKQYVPDNTNADQILLDRLKKAKKQNTNNYVVAHHEPQGEVLSEKRKLKKVKDISKKIPGYYDGKPSPVGFPMDEPPKMVNGFHPDLIDGKKVADRFNKMDPISARSMPATGNPHIDKKVKAAAKKPK